MNGKIKLRKYQSCLRRAVLLFSLFSFAGVYAEDRVDMQAMDMPV